MGSVVRKLKALKEMKKEHLENPREFERDSTDDGRGNVSSKERFLVFNFSFLAREKGGLYRCRAEEEEG